MSQFNPAPQSSSNSESEEFGQKLVARYVHSGNTVIQPISVDLTTGVFTSESPLPWSAGTEKTVITSYSNGTGYPTRLFAEWSGINNYSIRVIDTNTFYVITGGSIVTYADTANNQGVQINRFQFETDFSKPTIDLTQLDMGDEVMVVVSGVADRSGWRYTPISFTHDGGTDKVQFASIDGRDFMTFYMEIIFKYNREMGLLMSFDGDQAKREWQGGTNWYINKSRGSNRDFSIFSNLQWTKVETTYNMANNSVLEVYTTVKPQVGGN